MAPRQVRRSVWIGAAPEAVWAALTEPARLEAWYAPGCRWEIPRVEEGATMRFFNTETDVQSATIEACDPPRELGLTWIVHPGPPEEVRLLNRFLLTPEGGGTQVEITQDGYEALPAEEQAVSLRQDEEAYAAVATALKAYVEASAG